MLTRPVTRRRLVLAARVLFVVAVAVGAYVAFRGHGDEVLRAARDTSGAHLVVAAGLVLAGLGLTSVAWRRVLAGFGHRLPVLTGSAVFFVGQLGKYVPGGVWSIGAHAHLAAAHAVPVRVTAGTSLVFLGLNLATAGVVAGLCLLALDTTRLAGLARLSTGVESWPGWIGPVVAAVGLVTLHPGIVARAAGLVAGRTGDLVLSFAEVARLAGLLATTWLCYAGAAVLLLPGPSWALLALAAAATTVSYAVGVAVVLAPAGLGAREVTLVALLAPAVGLGPAGAVALLTRVLHTGADLVLALASGWAVGRSPGRRSGPSRPPPVAEATPRVRSRFSPPA